MSLSGTVSSRSGLLKGLASGMAKTIVTSVGAEDGFEALRRLHLRYEPRLVIRHQVLTDFATAMKPQALASGIADGGEEDEDGAGLDGSDTHARSVLVGILDPTRQHTAHKQSESFEVFKIAVLEFTNAAGMSQKDVSKPDPMQVDSVACSRQCAGSVQDSGCVGSEACGGGSDLERESIWAVGAHVGCHNCGRKVHFARD